MVIFQARREKNIGNMLSFLIVPYIILVFLNNFVIYRFGFYKISDKVLLMLLGAFIAFFIGMSLFSGRASYVIYEKDNENRFRHYNIDKMVKFLYFVAFLASCKLIYLIINGDITGSESQMGNGLVGHLLLICYAIVPIVFLYWTYNKKKLKYLFSVGLIVAMNFATFIKYNVIGLIVSIFIFTLIYKKSVLIKACVLLVSAVAILFISNYVIGFVLSNSLKDVSNLFYLNHLWKYSAGSLIYDNYIFDVGVNVGVGMFQKIAYFIFALPNMFLNKIFKITIFPYEIMPSRSVSSVGEYSNVTDAIGYMFPSRGGTLEIIGFLVLFVIIGALFSVIYNSCKMRNYKFSPFLANFMTFFVFLSFFGTFYVNPGPWEILVWSIIVPYFFRIKGKNVKSE